MIPDTQAYLILGLVATFVIMGFLVLSMVVRWRNLQKDAQLLDQLEREE
jgi:hypothetical protein